jgi:hypothetical protein
MLRKVVYVGMFLAVAAAAASAQTQNLFFKPPVWSSTSGTSFSSAVADLNGDGKSDVVYSDGTVLLAKTDGAYQVGTPWCTTGQPYCGPLGNLTVVTADVNQDGKPDLIIATSNFIWVLLGKGDGTFQAAVSSVTGSPSGVPVIADVNGDGKPDVILGSGGSTALAICLGNGDGTFQASIAGPNLGGMSIVAATDLNGDHKVDILATNGSQVAVYIGHGDGTFAATPVVTSPTLPSGNNLYVDVQVADFNGDGTPDLIVTQFAGPIPLFFSFYDPSAAEAAFILPGNGDGSFGATTQIAGRGGLISVGDVNGDGIADLVLEEGPFLDVLLGTGGGAVTFKASYFVDFTNFSRPILGDFNGDGKIDAFSGQTLLLGNGDGTLKGNFASFVPAQGPTLVADFNQDGKPDLAVPGNDSAIHILTGDGTGRFTASFATAAIPNPGRLTFSDLRSVDLNGDGKADLLVTVANTAPDTWTVYFISGNGDGTFNAPVAVAQSTQFTLASIAFADLNGDHKTDLVVSDTSGAINVFLGNGDGSFTPGTSFFGGVTTGVAIVAGDFNGDGKADLVVGIGTGLNFLAGKGDGTFATAVSATTLMGGPSVVADFNGDGILDLCGVNVVVLGNGDGTFRAGSTISNQGLAVGPVAYTIAVDLNGDGKLDLVGTAGGGSPVGTDILEYALGNGDGTFTPANLQTSFSSFGFSGVAAADVNGDGRPDILFAYAGGIVSMLNTQAPATPDFTATATSPSTSTVSAGQSATFGFNVTPMGGFAQTVSFTCSGAPANSTCTVSPTSAMVSGTAAVPIKVTVATTSGSWVPPTSFKSSPRTPQWPVGLVAIAAMFAILLATSPAFVGSNRKFAKARFRWATVGCSTVLVGASLLLVSCGGGTSSPSGSQPNSNSGTASGNYMIKVTGTSGSGASAVSHAVTFTLTVQ